MAKIDKENESHGEGLDKTMAYLFIYLQIIINALPENKPGYSGSPTCQVSNQNGKIDEKGREKGSSLLHILWL